MVLWLVMEVFRNPFQGIQILSNAAFHTWHHVSNVVIMIVLFIAYVWWSVAILENKLSMGDAA